MITRGRTDEPLTTDAQVRLHRARRMATLIRKLYEIGPDPSEDMDTLAQFLSKCLLAHEVDTLSILMDVPRARAKVRATKME